MDDPATWAPLLAGALLGSAGTNWLMWFKVLQRLTAVETKVALLLPGRLTLGED